MYSDDIGLSSAVRLARPAPPPPRALRATNLTSFSANAKSPAIAPQPGIKSTNRAETPCRAAVPSRHLRAPHRRRRRSRRPRPDRHAVRHRIGSRATQPASKLEGGDRAIVHATCVHVWKHCRPGLRESARPATAPEQARSGCLASGQRARPVGRPRLWLAWPRRSGCVSCARRCEWQDGGAALRPVELLHGHATALVESRRMDKRLHAAARAREPPARSGRPALSESERPRPSVGPRGERPRPERRPSGRASA
jgi:hypothetical protein